MGDFSEQVYNAVKHIPRGCVSSYGDVARAIGRPRSARYVGFALRGNPAPGQEIPCHRVVFADGQICDNFAFGGPEVQRRLLRDESVQFIDSMHVNMDTCRYSFSAETQERPTNIDWAREMGE